MTLIGRRLADTRYSSALCCSRNPNSSSGRTRRSRSNHPCRFSRKTGCPQCQTCHMPRERVIGCHYGAKVGAVASHRWLSRQHDAGEVLRLGYSGTRFSHASHSEFGRKCGLARMLRFPPRPARRCRNREFLAHLAQDEIGFRARFATCRIPGA
jgi:hypothetical protein